MEDRKNIYFKKFFKHERRALFAWEGNLHGIFKRVLVRPLCLPHTIAITDCSVL